MTEDQLKKSMQIIEVLISKNKSMRAFARLIAEDPADIHRWRRGKSQIKVRAIVSICRLCSEKTGLKPFDLNPDLFPDDLEFKFTHKKGAL